MTAAVGRLGLRQTGRPALIVTVVCAAVSAMVAAQYQTTFAGALDEGALRALVENPAIRVLFGPPAALDDPGGFTVWRTGILVLVLAGAWIMLAAIRITRGEEDAGRWNLLLAGRLRLVDVVLRCLAVMACSAVLISVAVGLAMGAAGTDMRGAAVYSAGILGVTSIFAATGVLAAQIMPNRQSAVGVSVAALGAALLLRMLADGIPALAWSAWLTPFGLVTRAAPYAQNRVAPLVVLAVAAFTIVTAALAAARRRDLGSGWVAVRTSRAPRTVLLHSLDGFAVRRALRPTAGWAVGIAAYFLVVGAMTAAIIGFLEQNPRFAELAAAAGFAGLNSPNGFAAALFTLVAIPSGLYASTRLSAFVADERARLWTMVFAMPVSRIRLLCNEIAVATVGVLGLHAVAALGMWVGAVLTDAPLQLTDALAGALNTAPIALLAVGAATLAVGWRPSAVGTIGALPVVGGFLLNAVGESAGAPTWVLNLSPFAHIEAVPIARPGWPAIAAFVAVTVVLAAAGIARYGRRDLTT